MSVTDKDKSSHLPGWLPPLLYLVLSTLFLWRSVFTSAVFLPAEMLGHVAPWSGMEHAGALPHWNPLRWDGIAQFFPWRLFASRTVHSGSIPLWNPYQFCGTPFLANSQSAPLYPGNLLFYLLPVARAFGYSAALHLTLCGWFTYLLLRRIRPNLCESAALMGGAVFAYSSWQINWLQLPTFLATSCWIPLLLRQADILVRDREHRLLHVAQLAVPVGMMLLAGHLQIAFYGLLAATLYSVCMVGATFVRGDKIGAARGLALCGVAATLGGAIAAPQVLPSLELSRHSHRTAPPSAAGYADYAGYALPAAGLVQIGLPDFFGSDADTDNPYWGFYLRGSGDTVQAIRHNPAETAIYVGIAPLILGLFAIASAAIQKRKSHHLLFFAALGVLALLMALGTPIDALFYYHVPGFSQSGSPARCLILWAFAWAILSALGLDLLLKRDLNAKVLFGKEALATILGAILVLSAGLSLVSTALQTTLPGFKELQVPLLGEAIGRVGEDWIRLLLLGGISVALLSQPVRKALSGRTLSLPVPGIKGKPLPMVGCLFAALVIIDLFVAGIRLNPTAAAEAVYPETPGIAFLKSNVGHERILPVNLHWSLNRGPHAVMPPNAATVFELRDPQGYDSLFTGAYKHFADLLSLPDPSGVPPGRRDASPFQVGNMVFIQDPNSPAIHKVSAKFGLTPSATAEWSPAQGSVPTGPRANVTDAGMDIYDMQTADPRARLESSGSGGDGVRWLRDEPTRVEIETTASAETRLDLNDQIYPGWKATLDGQPTELQRQPGEPIFRSVKVPAGRHTVAFIFAPATFRFGLFLALIAWGYVVAAWVGCRR